MAVHGLSGCGSIDKRLYVSNGLSFNRHDILAAFQAKLRVRSQSATASEAEDVALQASLLHRG